MTVIEYSAEWSNPMKVTMNDIASGRGVKNNRFAGAFGESGSPRGNPAKNS